SLLNEINSSRACHILTLEDPIEYIHQHKQSIVNQREIGHDSRTFANALRAALRQDPDVILVGEMRDLETIATAVTAAETGHLVLATLHTSSAPATIDRIIDVFPSHQQQQIRVQLADTLRGVVAQRLFPKKGEKGRVVACEILVGTSAIKNLIREGKMHQIPGALETGSQHGMQTFEQALKKLTDMGLIDPVQF
ncbi:MAG TPA: type IV pili twitching motility protein PilT, partial [Firmicutes bacterium]|nr:type IV pili twitching motility protein PilT [Bacillota bacterium]